MTVEIGNTTLTNTFDYWRNRTNEMADAMSTKVVTVESNTAVGNAAISGTFTANVFSGNGSLLTSVDADTVGGNTVSTINSYAGNKAANAYSNAVSTASTDATNKAATAYSNAVSYADTAAATAYSNAVSYADTAAATAYSNAVSYADTAAATAYSNAVSYAGTIAATAYSNSVTYFNSNVNTAIDSRVTKTFVDNLNVDADTLDGLDSGSFLRSDTGDTFSGGVLLIYNDAGIDITNTNQINGLQILQPTHSADALMSFHVSGDFALHFGLDGETNDLSVGGWSMGATKYRVWHAGNDGSGSGLDADLLDGQQGSYYYSPANPPPGGLPILRVYFSSTTWYKSAGLVAVDVEVWGGGGGSGSSGTLSGGTSSFGGYATATGGTRTTSGSGTAGNIILSSPYGSTQSAPNQFYDFYPGGSGSSGSYGSSGDPVPFNPGGPGGYARYIIPASILPSAVAVTVGAAGPAGPYGYAGTAGFVLVKEYY